MPSILPTHYESATASDVERICESLQHFNRPHAGAMPVTAVNLAARTADGALIGGIVAELALGWLEVHVLWVEPGFRSRRIGADLLAECERRAVVLGAHSARLDTFDWQAEAFYLRQGYACFGRLRDYPFGHERIFMQKRLMDPTKPST